MAGVGSLFLVASNYNDGNESEVQLIDACSREVCSCEANVKGTVEGVYSDPNHKLFAIIHNGPTGEVHLTMINFQEDNTASTLFCKRISAVPPHLKFSSQGNMLLISGKMLIREGGPPYKEELSIIDSYSGNGILCVKIASRNDACFTPDDSKFVCTYEKRISVPSVELWNHVKGISVHSIQSGEELWSFVPPLPRKECVGRCVVSWTGTTCVATWINTISAFNWETGVELSKRFIVENNCDDASSCRMSFGATENILVACFRCRMTVCDVFLSAHLFTIEHNTIRCWDKFAFDPVSSRMALVSDNSTIELYDMVDGRMAQSFPLNGDINPGMLYFAPQVILL